MLYNRVSIKKNITNFKETILTTSLPPPSWGQGPPLFYINIRKYSLYSVKSEYTDCTVGLFKMKIKFKFTSKV